MQLSDVAPRDKDALKRAANDQRTNIPILTQSEQRRLQIRDNLLGECVPQQWVVDQQQSDIVLMLDDELGFQRITFL